MTIDRLGRDGDGRAGAIRALFTLPGEVVRGPVTDDRLAPVEILAASAHRVLPVCAHFGTCGGCVLQHATDAFLADWKAAIVAGALAGRGLAAPLGPTVTSPPRSRIRAVFTARRTRKTVILGFHGRRSEDLVDVIECPVLRPEIMRARPALLRLAALGASRAQPLRLSVTVADGGLDVAVGGGKPLHVDLRRDLAALAEAHDFARLAWDGEPLALRRPPFQRFGAARVTPPPGAFLQATTEGVAALTAAVRIGVGDARRVADLFAGCGTFTLPLAAAAEVHAVEGDAAMLASLDAGWRGTTGLRRVTTEARDLFHRPLTASELARFDAVAIDPPRAGAEAQMRQLAASRVPRIAAVSCNPVSFARDAAILIAGGYRLDEVRVIDQFRWSSHIELAARFTR